MNGDIELEIGPGSIAGSYSVRVMRAAAGGEPTGTLELDIEQVLGRRETLEATLLASAVARRSGASAERPVREFGQQLFEALFTGPVYGMYRASLGVARQQGKRLRVVLRLTVPELAAVPWEMLFDPETETYVCRQEPLVRHVPAPYTVDPVEVRPPLRVLGLVASPRGLQQLNVEAEKDHLAQALAQPIADGLIEVVWVPEATWDGVHAQLLAGEWHVLHFVGHGDYDAQADEGVLALIGADGRADPVEASRLADLLGEAQPSPRLVVLNSCSSGRAGVNDLFSGTAAALARSGISAVAAMQFTISDAAAIAFARGFYTAIAHGRSVDDAVRSGRIAILGAPHSLEWVTPVLYVRGPNTQLFTLTRSSTSKSKGAPARQRVARAVPSKPTSPKESPARPEPPHSQQDHGVGVSSVEATHGVAAAVRQQAPARPNRPQRSSALRSLTRTRTARAAVAALAIAMVGVIMALYFPFGSRPGWPYDTGSAVYAQPLIANGVVYVGSTNGHVYALDADTGAVRWQYPHAGRPAIGPVYASPGIAGNMVYVGSDDGRIYALKASTGGLAWSRPCNKLGDHVRSSPVLVDGVVYATSGSGYVCARRAVGGARYWKPVWVGPGAPGSSPTVAPYTPGTGLNRISIYVGSGDGHVHALNAGSGVTQWEFPPKDQPGVGMIDSQPAMSADGSAVYAASSGGHLYALAAGTGSILWEYPPKNQPGIGTVNSQPAVAGDGSAVYIAGGFDVYALDASSGTPLHTWKSDPVQLSSTIDTAGPALGTDAIYVGGGKHVNCLNRTNGALCWSPPFIADSRVVSTPAVNNKNGNIYFGTLDGKVYASPPSGR